MGTTQTEQLFIKLPDGSYNVAGDGVAYISIIVLLTFALAGVYYKWTKFSFEFGRMLAGYRKNKNK